MWQGGDIGLSELLRQPDGLGADPVPGPHVPQPPHPSVKVQRLHPDSPPPTDCRRRRLERRLRMGPCQHHSAGPAPPAPLRRRVRGRHHHPHQRHRRQRHGHGPRNARPPQRGPCLRGPAAGHYHVGPGGDRGVRGASAGADLLERRRVRRATNAAVRCRPRCGDDGGRSRRPAPGVLKAVSEFLMKALPPWDASLTGLP